MAFRSWPGTDQKNRLWDVATWEDRGRGYTASRGAWGSDAR
jgi:hypothetical protein